MVMVCNICGSKSLSFDGTISAKCHSCKALINLQTLPLDYSNQGGQDIPSIAKSELRYRNAEQRLEVVKSYCVDKNYNFVDIGCGSGEMVKAAGEFFQNSAGYDVNSTLIDYCIREGVQVYKKEFDRSDFANGFPCVISVNHVLEHVNKPVDFLERIKSNMYPGDILYIEVPLYTGYAFQRKKYAYKLWYPEHVALYSMATLETLAEIMKMQILEAGYRNFYSDNFNTRLILQSFVKNPFLFAYRVLTRRKYQLILDNVSRDYGFIVLKR